MFKYKVIVFTFLTAVLITGKAYCQQEMKDHQVRTILGTVIYTDVEGGSVNVQTDKGKMTFIFEGESDLIQMTRHIGSLEIEKGDPVKIQYIVSSSGRNSIIKLVDNRPYGK